jgi:hypothetical protein
MGGSLRVSLEDDYEVMDFADVAVACAEWKWYTVNLTPDMPTTQGRIKIEFNS